MRPQAVRDIDSQAEYLAIHAGESVAHHFHGMVEETIANVLTAPESGAPWESDSPRLRELRYRIVRRFKNHVVFYRVTNDAVEIVRLLRGAQDLEQCLEENDE